MNFFKKVITFFSAIWNAILWRKPNRKAKQVSKSSKEDESKEKEKVTNVIPEAEKLFVDVPLHSPVDSEFKEQQLTKEETTASFSPIVALNIETQSDAFHKLEECSTGGGLLKIEEDASRSLSFFSEPAPEEKVRSLPVKSDELLEENVINSDEIEIEPLVEEDVVNPVEQALAGLPTPRCDSENGHNDVKCILPPSETSATYRLSSASETQTLQTYGLDALQPKESKDTSANHICVIQKHKINPDLSFLAIGDEIHLFDHDGIADIQKEIEETEDSLVEEIISEPVSCTAEAIPIHIENTLSVSEVAPDISVSENSVFVRSPASKEGMELTESLRIREQNDPTSSEVGSLGLSVSSIQGLASSCESAVESCRKYSTNYMVKSDSLVNFLPEDGIVPVEDAVELESHALPGKEEAKPYNGSINSLNEGCLEEMMCTNRGVIKLSGDHHFECVDDETHVITSVADILNDEEPLHGAHHLEGCILDEPFLEPHHSPIFREILKTAESGLEDSDMGELTRLRIDPCGTQTDLFRQYILNNPEPLLEPTRRKVDQNKRDARSPCNVRKFPAFPLADDPERTFSKDDLPVSGIPTLRFGEVLARNPSVSSEKITELPIHDEGSNPVKRFTIASVNSGFLDGPDWRVALPLAEPEVTEIHDHVSSTSLSSPQGNSIPGNRKCMPERLHADDDEHDFYPFLDCSSYLFRIPEEIRKETSFNPCVGAAPMRRPCATPSNVDASFGNEHNSYGNKYSSMNPLVPNCLVPLINPPVPDEYRMPGLTKLPEGYEFNQDPVPQSIGTFWGTHPGIVQHQGDQQQSLVGYPVSCSENYYEDEDMNVISSGAYPNEPTPDGYGYLNTYGTVEFPPLTIPPAFIPRGPLIFPIGQIPPTENMQMINQEAPIQNEQYPIPHRLWGSYRTGPHLQNDEDVERDPAEVRGLAQLENISTGTNEDDGDLESNSMLDPYYQLAENNSLHTVKSKADSFTGSLFCESLRSLISHNTENENILPSFSCSSVQGCCPSVIVQSCEPTLSNDSLPSIIMEEANYTSKSVDDDYLATEKFMNDVNTALNESVIDQILERVDLHSNLLGRGDGSMPMDPEQCVHDNTENTDTDMLRNSLGENISINNSKLTLLDGVLGSDNESQADPLQNFTCDKEEENFGMVREFCQEVLESLLERATSFDDQSDTEVQIETTASNGNLDQSLLPGERDLIVQNMFLEGASDQIRHPWGNGLRGNQKHALEEAAPSNSSDTLVAEGIPSIKLRRNRRRKKKSDVGDLVLEPCGSTKSMTDSQQTFHLVDSRSEQDVPHTSKSEEIANKAEKREYSEAGTSFPGPAGYEPNVAINDDGLEEEFEPGENPGNPSTRRRRNRRKKRKN